MTTICYEIAKFNLEKTKGLLIAQKNNLQRQLNDTRYSQNTFVKMQNHMIDLRDVEFCILELEKKLKEE